MNATGLEILQRHFEGYVLHGDPAIRDQIAPGRLDDRDRRLAIYFDAYRLRLVEALGTDFGAVRVLLGESAFDAAARGYIDANPSTFRNLRWYGATFATFLRSTAPWSADPTAAELAEFEWKLTLAFDASDAPSLTFEAMTTIEPADWATLRLRLHPSVQRIELAGNVPALRKAVDVGDALPPVVRGDAVPWLIWRRDLGVHFRSLTAPEAWALDAAMAGATFPELCDGFGQWFDAEEAATHAALGLRGWIDEALIVGYNAGDPPPE